MGVAIKKLMAGSPAMLAITYVTPEGFAKMKEIPLCKLLKKEGVEKTKIFFTKLDKHATEVKKIRDQYLAFLKDQEQSDAKVNPALLVW